MVANLDKILELIDPGNFRAAMAFLAVSFLCGAALKFRWTLVAASEAIDPYVNGMENTKQ
ncbi:hypothetical protein [Polaromonas sp.]|uniref:hypothetical protein n=1 Tax=Polaromonas sp. TaxID=1869339 RepID=UPI003568DFAD